MLCTSGARVRVEHLRAHRKVTYISMRYQLERYIACVKREITSVVQFHGRSDRLPLELNTEMFERWLLGCVRDLSR
jgi:hypothetical protein